MSRTTKEILIKRANKFFKSEKFEKCIKTSNKILKRYPVELDIYA